MWGATQKLLGGVYIYISRSRALSRSEVQFVRVEVHSRWPSSEQEVIS